ncbi:MAG: hypothetical protein EAZ99_18925, partial [Alphaproteobacteria bacterium]
MGLLITRVVQLVPEVDDPPAANKAAAKHQATLRANRGDRVWLDPAVTVLVRAKTDHFLPDLIRRIDGIAKDPPFIQLHKPTGQLPVGFARFRFDTRWIPFIGRLEELAKIKDLLSGDQPFRWMLGYGSGGAGKSRLALEACDQASGEGWVTGFLDRRRLAGFVTEACDVWQPLRPTLIVIDYPAEEPQSVSDLLHGLAGRAEDLAHPVRVLLLERDAQGEWIKKLGLERSGSGSLTNARAPNLLVGSSNTADMLHIQRAVYQARAKAPPTAEEAKRFSSQLAALAGAPTAGSTMLSAMLLADAMARGEAFGTPGQPPTSFDLYQSALKHERGIWDHHGLGADQRAVLALATVTLGLTRRDHDRVIADKLEVMLPTPTQCRIVAGPDCDTDALPPLRPDPLGEAFVAEWLATDGAENPRRREAVAALAWALDPRPTAVFLLRCAADLPADQHQELETWLGRAATGPDAGSEPRRWWSAYVVERTALATADTWRRGKDMLNGLERLASTYPEEPELRVRLARSTVNLVARIGVSDLAAAQALSARLETLATEHPDQLELRVELAKGAFNLLTGHLKQGDLAEAQALLARLETLATEHPDQPDLRVQLAKGAFNLLTSHLEQGDLAAAQPLLARLEALATGYPDQPELQALFANGAFNLLTGHLKQGDLAEAQA